MSVLIDKKVQTMYRTITLHLYNSRRKHNLTTLSSVDQIDFDIIIF